MLSLLALHSIKGCSLQVNKVKSDAPSIDKIAKRTLSSGTKAWTGFQPLRVPLVPSACVFLQHTNCTAWLVTLPCFHCLHLQVPHSFLNSRDSH